MRISINNGVFSYEVKLEGLFFADWFLFETNSVFLCLNPEIVKVKMGISRLPYAQWHSYNISNAFVRTLVNWQINTGEFFDVVSLLRHSIKTNYVNN